MRRPTYLLLLFCLGCHTAPLPAPDLDDAKTAPTQLAQIIPATGSRDAGKTDAPTGAIHSPQPSPAKLSDADFSPKADPADTASANDDRHLTLAAYYLDKGKDELACFHLGQFVERNPRHPNGRFYYAELLLKLDRLEDAREQFELVIADLQEAQFLDLRTVVHCHGRLTDIAVKAEDEFERQLHRGIALYWLAQVPGATKEEEALMPVEGLFCKAAVALTQAHHLDPDHARPCWYLHNVWHKLGQNHPAQRYLHIAQARAAFSPLTPSEHRGMLLVQK